MSGVSIDFEAEGLLDGASDRDARLELLRTLEDEGFTLDGLREAAAHDRLALLPIERVLAGEGRLYTQEELTEETGLDREFQEKAARALGVPVRAPGERAITEEELALSRSAKALLDAGLSEEALAPEGGGAVVRGFEKWVAEAVAPPVKLVKTIGDAAMLVAPEPAPVVGAVLALVERSKD